MLHPDQYPDITFRSTNVTAKPLTRGRYEVKIDGDLTLHGVTKRITIPARDVERDRLRAVGKFSIDRDDFKVKATSAFHGLVRVMNTMKFEFDIVGQASINRRQFRSYPSSVHLSSNIQRRRLNNQSQILKLRLPAEFTLDLVRARNQDRRVAGTSWSHANGNLFARYSSRRLDHLAHTVTIATTAEVVNRAALTQHVQREDMRRARSIT